MNKEPNLIYLKDYQPPAYYVDSIDLVFDLYEDHTHVNSVLKCRRNEMHKEEKPVMVLQGDQLILKSLKCDGKILNASEYTVNEEALNISNLPNTFTLEIETEIHPEKNTELSGLYLASHLFCTQCEADGFRKMTYFPDRPDVMSKFTTKIQADKVKCPVLLSNGNLIAQGELENNRHWVKWEDPFKKPCYLFALVAGDLVSLEDHFVTKSNRLVTLRIYVERENQDKCAHAMAALKKAMHWDEDRYGREYDLNIYMIVAVNDFNMGAMENKGLNVFNSKYILARPETATDFDYEHIDAVVGHEYFHNWTGNRITCRDWFQLSLKEGLTVFREHQFSEEIFESPVSRIENVLYLRNFQFSEDAGPLAHSVRPESYIEVNNFYTTTVYEKGSEVIRMLKTLLGWETFRRGMDIYFERHDGEAVTIEDFVAAFEAASKRNLTQFRLWYSQAGTPEISVEEEYQPETQSFILRLNQFCPPTPEQPEKLPMHIPIAIGLLDDNGKDLLPNPTILELTKEKQSFEFKNISKPPILSLLRDFSAPVKIKSILSSERLAFLLAHDSDAFSRWDAGQMLTKRELRRLLQDYKAKKPLEVNSLWLEAYHAILKEETLDPAMKATMLTLPSLLELLELETPIDIEALHKIRTFLKETLAKKFKETWLSLYKKSHVSGPYRYIPKDVNLRSLKNLSLNYLIASERGKNSELCLAQWHHSDNMTDSMAALSILSNYDCPERETLLQAFYDKWQYNTLVLDKWFRIQATSELPNTLEVVQSLMKHPAFNLANPNKVYSLLGAFSGNLLQFHNKSGKGYTLLADVIIQLNTINPQIAARLISAFGRWKKFDNDRQEKMSVALKRILATPNLSKDVYELASKSLK